jgi:hypothetical protein
MATNTPPVTDRRGSQHCQRLHAEAAVSFIVGEETAAAMRAMLDAPGRQHANWISWLTPRAAA